MTALGATSKQYGCVSTTLTKETDIILPLLCHVTLGKYLSFSEPLFPYLLNGYLGVVAVAQ